MTWYRHLNIKKHLVMAALLISSQAFAADTTSGKPQTGTFLDKGVKVGFSIEPMDQVGPLQRPLVEGDMARIRFRITEEESGKPISPLEPGVWISKVRPQEKELTCKKRIERLLQGTISFQADVDLNKYFILVMNNDHTISVIDPILGINGYSQLYAMAILEESGEDWVVDAGQKTMYVSMPRAGQVAVVGLNDFKVATNLDAGRNPMRLALQPDEHYLWVGNDDLSAEKSSVTVIDLQKGEIAAQFKPGPGHHEIAFSSDSLRAYVVSSLAKTLTMYDTQTLKPLQTVKLDGDPVSVKYAPLSELIYVALQKTGDLLSFDRQNLNQSKRLKTAPGLLRFELSPDKRWGFMLNTRQNRIDVLDIASGKLVLTKNLNGGPYQVSFTDNYAFIQFLYGTEVVLIPLSQLGIRKDFALQRVPTGNKPPGGAFTRSNAHKRPSIANNMSRTGEYGALLIANPAENLIYYYMEGMIAPMGTYTTYGRIPRAVRAIDRSVHEMEKGVYEAQFIVPDDGEYKVAFLLDTPWLDHCFSFEADANPILVREEAKRNVTINFTTSKTRVPVGKPTGITFDATLADGPLSLEQIQVLITRLPGNWQQRGKALRSDQGRYSIEFTPDAPGVYYAFLSIPQLSLGNDQLPFLVLRAMPDKQ